MGRPRDEHNGCVVAVARALACVGIERAGWSQRRADGFAAAGGGLPQQRMQARLGSLRQQAGMIAWVRDLPPRCGIFAVCDALSAMVARALRHAGRALGIDAMLLGVDDDALICEATTPRLCSIMPPAGDLGRHAVAVGDAWLRDGRVPTSTEFAPLGVHERESTTLAMHADPLVQAMLVRIAGLNLRAGGVEALARMLGVSARRLTEHCTARTLANWMARAPVIDRQLRTASSVVGARETFGIAAHGPAPVRYRWQSRPAGGSFADIAGATGLAYTTPTLTAAMHGTEYSCIATNRAGSAITNATTLSVVARFRGSEPGHARECG